MALKHIQCKLHANNKESGTMCPGEVHTGKSVHLLQIFPYYIQSIPFEVSWLLYLPSASIFRKSEFNSQHTDPYFSYIKMYYAPQRRHTACAIQRLTG
jgi:hypothetical protein